MVQVVAGRAKCVWADFREVFYAVMFAFELYVVLCDHVTLFHSGNCDIDAFCSLFWVSQCGLHGCW